MALEDGFIYRLVDPQGRVVSGYNKDTNYYTSLRSAKSARAQLRHRRGDLIIQRTELGIFTSVE